MCVSFGGILYFYVDINSAMHDVEFNLHADVRFYFAILLMQLSKHSMILRNNK